MNTLEVNIVETKGWFLSLEPTQQIMVKQTLELYDRELRLDSNLHDYSFLVFPMSKAYEGFLKKYLLDMDLITQSVYEGKRFRIGRALNPDVYHDQRDKYWLYDDLSQACGEELARQLWETWLQCRNRVFHYFPLHQNVLDLDTAEEYLLILMTTMEKAFYCKVRQ